MSTFLISLMTKIAGDWVNMKYWLQKCSHQNLTRLKISMHNHLRKTIMALDRLRGYLNPCLQFLQCIQWSDSAECYIQVWKAGSGTSVQHSSTQKYQRLAWLGKRIAINSRRTIDGMIVWSQTLSAFIIMAINGWRDFIISIRLVLKVIMQSNIINYINWVGLSLYNLLLNQLAYRFPGRKPVAFPLPLGKPTA